MANDKAPSTAEEEDDNTCDCKTCRFFYGLDLPAPEALPFNQLLVKVRAASLHIYRAWLHLHIVLKRHENVIRKRWLKKSRQQKTSILTDAWPGLPLTSRPDFAGIRNGCARHFKRINKAKLRETHLWPFINLENLVEPETLLVYINSRGRYLPWTFFHADLSTAHIDNPRPNAQVDQYRMRTVGCSTPRSYGAPLLLEAQTCQKDQFGLDVTRLAAHPYNVSLVFEVQSRILDFLCACCHAILRDHDLDCLMTLPTLSVCSITSITNTLSSITAYAAMGPYMPPQSFDAPGMMRLLQTRTEEAADHLWALREDPGYFAQQLLDWAEHDPANILGSDRKPHPELGTMHFWSHTASRMISHAYCTHVSWHDATSHWASFHTTFEIMRQYPRYFFSAQGRAKVETTFRMLDAHLMDFLCMPLCELRVGFAASPPLRSGYVRPQNTIAPYLEELSRRAQHPKAELRLDVLFRCLLLFDQHRLHGTSGIVEEVQRTLNVEKDGDLISSWVAGHFADVAMIVEATRQLKSMQPWTTIFRGSTDDSDSWLDTPPYCCIGEDIEDIKSLVNFEIHRSWSLVPSALHYPCDKKPTEKSINEMRMSETVLDQFWHDFDCSMRSVTGHVFERHLTRPQWKAGRKLQRTLPWKKHPCYLAALLTPKRKNLSSSTNSPVTTILTDLDPNARVARPLKLSMIEITPTRSDKIKTKGLTTPVATSVINTSFSPANSDTADAKDDSVEVVFRLNKRAYKVFATLFHLPNGTSIVADICWSDILYAMSSLDFATEKLYGSSWQFVPPLDLPDVRDDRTKQGNPSMKPIQFHEPHPASKLRYWEGKRLGRRLHRHYGWVGGMFECK